MSRPPVPAIERFNTKYTVDKSTGCWLWTACKTEDGYGSLSVWPKRLRAHRWSYQHHVGEIPDGMCVCHKCDNPICVNPDHLFLGTHQDNMADRNRKGRQHRPQGELSGTAKITEETVILIKKFLARHPLQAGKKSGQVKFLSDWFGICHQHVSNIHTGKRWRHIT